MDDKKRKGAIVVAAILGLVAALYLAGLLAQVLNNYSIWMEGGGLTGQTQMPPVEFSPMVCFPQAFTWNGLKGIEYHQVLLAPVRQLGRFAVEVEHFDIVHFARQFLCCGCGCREREGRQHRDYFHLHYILFFGFK